MAEIGAGAGPAAALLELALFPLKSVLFPGALLPLKVFEARYLDLVVRCLRERKSFGVVCLLQGNDHGRAGVRSPHLADDPAWPVLVSWLRRG